MEEDFKNMLIPVMGRSNKAIHYVLEQRMQSAKTDLTLKQFILLNHVSKEERPQSALAMITNRDKGSLTRLIQSLENKEFVIRRVSEADCRMNLVSITTKGKSSLKKARKVVKKAFDELTDFLSESEKKSLRKIHLKLTNRASEIIAGNTPN